jgi:hypothetical protein
MTFTFLVTLFLATSNVSGQSFNPSALACSRKSRDEARWTYKNENSFTVEVLWNDFGCSEKLGQTMSPGQTQSGRTFIGHTFLAKDNNGVIVDTFQIKSSTEYWNIDDRRSTPSSPKPPSPPRTTKPTPPKPKPRPKPPPPAPPPPAPPPRPPSPKPAENPVPLPTLASSIPPRPRSANPSQDRAPPPPMASSIPPRLVAPAVEIPQQPAMINDPASLRRPTQQGSSSPSASDVPDQQSAPFPESSPFVPSTSSQDTTTESSESSSGLHPGIIVLAVVLCLAALAIAVYLVLRFRTTVGGQKRHEQIGNNYNERIALPTRQQKKKQRTFTKPQTQSDESVLLNVVQSYHSTLSAPVRRDYLRNDPRPVAHGVSTSDADWFSIAVYQNE